MDAVTEGLVEQYEESSGRRSMPPRPKQGGPMTQAQAVKWCASNGIGPSRIVVQRLMEGGPDGLYNVV